MSKSQSLYGIKSISSIKCPKFLFCCWFYYQTFLMPRFIFGKGSREESSRVTLTPYLPEKNKKKVAIITCPGSSYHWIDRRAENTDVAHWLQSRGIAAFVLKYRTVGIIPYPHIFTIIFQRCKAAGYVPRHSTRYSGRTRKSARMPKMEGNVPILAIENLKCKMLPA